MKYFLMPMILSLFVIILSVSAQSSVFADTTDDYQGEIKIEDFIEGLGHLKIEPVISNNNFKVEKFVSGLEWPTTMTFVNQDILILEKNKGTVRHIQNGILLDKPVLDLDVASSVEGGLLGITSVGTDVYLFFTESSHDGGKLTGTKIFKYHWNGNELVEGILIRDISKNSFSNYHHGGILTANEDGRIFVVTGDNFQEGKNQNFSSDDMDDTSAIFDIKQEKHYAIGIRNSFGLAIDPITKNIWMTENGVDGFDEINLVIPKFNSGWKTVMGPASQEEISSLSKYTEFVYSDPEFSWERAVGVTAISFIESDVFKELDNSVLVGDFNNGNLYKFNLNNNRTDFIFEHPSLKDLVAHKIDPDAEIIFGVGFSGITDIKVGPNGMIYVVSIGDGAVYRIIPSEQDLGAMNILDCESALNSATDFSGCDFSGLNLDGVNLSGFNLSGVDFSGANLENSILIHSNLDGADLSNANLSNSKLTNAVISNANLDSAKFSGSDMRRVTLEHANLSNAEMQNVNLVNANLNHANLKNVNLTHSKLNYGSFENTELVNVDLSYSDLRSAKFIQANLREASLINNNIRNATFLGSDLSNAKIFGLYPYSSIYFKEGIIYSEETTTDICLGNDFSTQIFNRILYELRQIKLDFASIESLITNICSP